MCSTIAWTVDTQSLSREINFCHSILFVTITNVLP